MRKRFYIIVAVVIMCISITGIQTQAASPSMTGNLKNGTMTVTVTGLDSSIAQVTLLAKNNNDEKDHYIYTENVSNCKASFSFKVKGTSYTIQATTKNSDGKDVASLTPIVVNAAVEPGVSYRAHVQKIGWQNYVSNGAVSGTTGKALRIEALKIKLTGTLPSGASIKYKVHVQTYGWQNTVSDDQMAGTTGLSKRMEAIRITLSGMPGYTVKYRVHVQKKGWMPWVSTPNGTAITKAPIAGTVGQALRIEAIQIQLVK